MKMPNNGTTGMSDDLFVHLFTSFHFVVNTVGPDTISSIGGLRYWKDGREAPDVRLGIFNYPQAESHPGFNLSLYCNFDDPTSESDILRLVGSKASMDVSWETVGLKQNKGLEEQISDDEKKNMEVMGYDSPRKKMLPPSETFYRVEDEYRGTHFDHKGSLIYAIKTGGQVFEDQEFGFRAGSYFAL